jgi:hypothetical protein
MLDRLRTLLLGWLRVPPQPHPPAGAPGGTMLGMPVPGFINKLLGR